MSKIAYERFSGEIGTKLATHTLPFVYLLLLLFLLRSQALHLLQLQGGRSIQSSAAQRVLRSDGPMAVKGVLPAQRMATAGHTHVTGSRALALQTTRPRGAKGTHGATSRSRYERRHVGASVALTARFRGAELMSREAGESEQYMA